MKRWIHASTDTIDAEVRKYIEDRISREDISFLDDNGDFGWAQDEVAYCGNISDCIDYVKKEMENDPSITDFTEVISDSYEILYDIGEIVRLFRQHGVELPDWYF